MTREIPFGRPSITDAEREAVAEVLASPILTHGPRMKAFESAFGEFTGGHAVAVSSCMAALHLAYLGLGIGPGDDVLVSAQTHTATAHAVEWVGARPVFVDCDPGTGNVTAAALEAALTPNTRAIGLVHFIGIPCDMPAIMAVAERHQLKVVEDCALAIDSRWDGTHVGLFGDVGCFSFYPVKHLTTGEGGMFLTRHADLAAETRLRRGFGVDRTHGERREPGIYDVTMLGLNYRMSELQAALGEVQVARAPGLLASRRANLGRLRAGLEEVEGVRLLTPDDPASLESAYCACAVLEAPIERSALVAALRSQGVGTSVYYPHPVPRLHYYQQRYGYDSSAFPGAETISDRSIALPVGPHLSVEDMDHIVVSLKSALREARV